VSDQPSVGTSRSTYRQTPAPRRWLHCIEGGTRGEPRPFGGARPGAPDHAKAGPLGARCSHREPRPGGQQSTRGHDGDSSPGAHRWGGQACEDRGQRSRSCATSSEHAAGRCQAGKGGQHHQQHQGGPGCQRRCEHGGPGADSSGEDSPQWGGPAGEPPRAHQA
jgi:hypothetical protein